MKNIRKRTLAFILVFAMVIGFSGLYFEKTKVQAADASVYFYEDKDFKLAHAGKPVSYRFVVDVNCTTYIGVVLAGKLTEVDMVVFDNSNNVIKKKSFLANEGKMASPNEVYYYEWGIDLEGDKLYNVQISFGDTAYYSACICRNAAVFNKTKIILTKGFSTTLKVNGGKVKDWKSSNTKVATVKNGKVTGKKKGNATITATLKDRSRLKCKIFVKNNVYSSSKVAISNVDYGRYAKVYKAYYSGRKLVIIVRIINNTGTDCIGFENLKVAMKTNTGKTIGKFDVALEKTNIPAYAIKYCKFIIDKPEIKKADLRVAETLVKAKLTYYD